jgi:hypothetical protein
MRCVVGDLGRAGRASGEATPDVCRSGRACGWNVPPGDWLGLPIGHGLAHEPDLHGRPRLPELHLVGVVQDRVAANRVAVDQRPVPAPGVPHDPPGARAREHGMPRGHVQVPLGVEREITGGMAPDGDLILREDGGHAGAYPAQDPDLELHRGDYVSP